MWLTNIPRHNVTVTFPNVLFFANDTDASATTGCCRLKDVHMFIVVYLAIDLPAFVILWKNISCGSDIKRLAIESSHSLDIPPHLILAANAPRSGKMVNLLIAVKIFNPVLLKEPSPADIPIWVLYMFKTGHLKRVNNTVIHVCGLWHFEAHGQERFQLFLVVLHNLWEIFRKLSLNFQKWCVGEKEEWLSVRKWALD